MTAIPKVPIGGGSGNLTATYLLQNHTGDTGLTSAWYMIDLATSAGGPGHLYILADGTPLVDPTVYIQGYPLNPTSVTFAQAPNNLATDAAFTYTSGLQTLAVPFLQVTTVFSAANLNLTTVASVVINPAIDVSLAPGGTLLIQPTVATRLVGQPDGFVVTTGGTGTLSIDTTSYQPAGSYLTGSLTSGRVALSVTATSVTDDAGFTYDAASNIATATGAFLSPVFYNPFGAVTVQAQGGTLLLDAVGVGDAITLQSRNGDVTLACNTSVTGPTINLLRTAAGGGLATLTTRAVVASGASAVLDAWDWTAGVVTITGNTNITTAAGVNLAVIRQPTYFASNVLTVTNAATLVIEGAPQAGINAIITNSYALWIQGGIAVMDTITSNNATNLLLEAGGTQMVSISTTQLTVVGHIVPSADLTYTLGDSTHTWSVLWVENIGMGGVKATITFVPGGGATEGLDLESNTTGSVIIGHQNVTQFISDVNGVAWFGATTGVAQQTVTGLKGGNAALGSLLTALAAYGLIIDSSGP